MALAFVAERKAATGITSGVAFSVTANTAAGNTAFLLLGSTLSTTTGVSITDSQGNTWTLDATGGGASSGQWAGIAHAYLTKALLTTDTITVTWTNGSLTAIVAEFSAPTVLVVDKTASSDNALASNSNCGTTARTTYPTEIVIGAFINSTATGPYTPNTGYTMIDAGSGPLNGLYQLSTSNTTFNPKPTFTGSDTSAGTTATYKPAHNYRFNTNSLRPHPFSPGLAR